MDIACATAKAATGYLKEMFVLRKPEPEPEHVEDATDISFEVLTTDEPEHSCEKKTVSIYALWRGFVA